MRLLHLRQRVGGGFALELRTQWEFHGFGLRRSVSPMDEATLGPTLYDYRELPIYRWIAVIYLAMTVDSP